MFSLMCCKVLPIIGYPFSMWDCFSFPEFLEYLDGNSLTGSRAFFTLRFNLLRSALLII